MKRESKTEVKNKIDDFFKKESFTSKEARKIKRLAMKYNIKLGSYRKSFCKKCLSQLKGQIRINKGYKTVKCEVCGALNRIKLR